MTQETLKITQLNNLLATTTRDSKVRDALSRYLQSSYNNGRGYVHDTSNVKFYKRGWFVERNVWTEKQPKDLVHARYVLKVVTERDTYFLSERNFKKFVKQQYNINF